VSSYPKGGRSCISHSLLDIADFSAYIIASRHETSSKTWISGTTVSVPQLLNASTIQAMQLTNPTAKQKNERKILERILADGDWSIEVVHTWPDKLELEYKLRNDRQLGGERIYCFLYGSGIPPLADHQIEALFRRQLENPDLQRTA